MPTHLSVIREMWESCGSNMKIDNIKLNIHEAYLISRLLDSNPVFSLKPPSNVLLLHESAIASLIDKDILSDRDTFTDDGAMLAKRIIDYKSCQKYLKLNDMSFGLVDETQSILLKRIYDNNIELYSFYRTETRPVVSRILSEWNVLQCSLSDQELVASSTVEEKTLFKKCALKRSNCLFVSTICFVDKPKCTDELLFRYNNKIYLYNRISNKLSLCNTNRINSLLMERMATAAR